MNFRRLHFGRLGLGMISDYLAKWRLLAKLPLLLAWILRRDWLVSFRDVFLVVRTSVDRKLWPFEMTMMMRLVRENPLLRLPDLYLLLVDQAIRA